MQRRTRFAVTGLALVMVALSSSLDSAAAPTERAELVSRYDWRSEDPRFGGFSAVELSDDGRSILVISDRGSWTKGTIQRDADERISAVSLTAMEYLKDTAGAPLRQARADSEGMALAKDGTLYVSFEGAARVLRYAHPGAAAEILPSHPDFARMIKNAALEALAIDDRGRLYTLPEDTRDKTADFPIYRFENGGWSQPFTLPRRGEFLPVGADFGPDGRFYLLERGFYGLGGFAARVRAFTFSDTGILAEETVLQTPAGRYENLEGLAVWRDASGAIRLTMVSDDNQLFFLRNALVEYRLRPATD